MKKALFFCSIAVALLSSFTNALSQTEYEIAHDKEEAERRAMIDANLPLRDSVAEAFWDLYAEYRVADTELDEQRADLMRRFAESYEDLHQEEGNRIVTDALRIEEQRQSLKKRFFEKFAAVLPGQALFRYYQIETKMDATKRHEWTQLIPLVPISE